MKDIVNADQILIVDDEPTNIQALYTLLKDEYQIKVANCGEKAYEIAKKMQPDLILLDIVMPKMDGYFTCKALKNDPQTRHIPVIFVTAKDKDEEEARGFEIGAVDYITKPYSPIVVKARIKTQLQLKHLNENLQEAVEVEVNKRMQMQEKLAAQDAFDEKETPSRYLWIRTHENPQTLTLEVEDNAGGISEAVKERIFDPYVSTKSDEKGTGIGLYMSKTIIEEHAHGSINVVNTKEGAKFTIILPK